MAQKAKKKKGSKSSKKKGVVEQSTSSRSVSPAKKEKLLEKQTMPQQKLELKKVLTSNEIEERAA